MASITLSVSEEFKREVKRLAWVNWSELARKETTKKLIFEDYLKTGKISDKDWEFCEKIDWHPVDELPLKEEFKKEMTRRKGKTIRVNSVDEIFR